MTTFCDRCGAPVGAGQERCGSCGWPVPVPLTPAERGEVDVTSDEPPRADDDPTPPTGRAVAPAWEPEPLDVDDQGTAPMDAVANGPSSEYARPGTATGGLDDPSAYGRWRLQADPELAQWRVEPDDDGDDGEDLGGIGAVEGAPRRTFGVGADEDEPSGSRVAVRVLAGLAAAVVVALVGLAVLFFGVLRPSGDRPSVASPATTTSSTTTAPAETSSDPATTTPTPSASPSSTAYPAVTLAGKPCGGNGSGPWSKAAAGSSATSCPFALQVQAAFLASAPQPEKPRTISATSPVTGKAYPMTCNGNQPVTCRGGNGAVVYLYGGAATFG